MTEKMTWEEIEKLFDQEWIELIDYDWSEQAISPRSGIVRVHAKERSEFDKLAAIDPPRGSAFIFVGEPKLPPNSYLSTFRVLELA